MYGQWFPANAQGCYAVRIFPDLLPLILVFSHFISPGGSQTRYLGSYRFPSKAISLCTYIL